MTRLKRFLRLTIGFIVVIAIGVTGTVWSARALVHGVGRLPEAASFEQGPTIILPDLAQTSRLFDSAGAPVGEIFKAENREEVTLDKVSQPFRTALLAVEDDNFYTHSGVNVGAILRAFKANSDAGRTVQGGSTITQQLVKNSLTGDERSFDRKIREAMLALRLEQQWCEGRSKSDCKDDILEQYVNTIYLGRGAYGVQAGARTWFGTDAAQLGWAEAAMLVAMIRNPTGYDPLRNAALAKTRRSVVAKRLIAVGAIDEPTAALIDAAPIPTRTFVIDSAANDQTLTEFQKRVRDEILQAKLPGIELLGPPEFRERLLFKGGLRVFTTWDQNAQRLADQAVAANPLVPDNPGIAASLVALEPGSGAVRAIVGEWRTPDGGTLEIANPRIGRSPGSSFKTFTLVTAVEQGHSMRDGISTAQVPRKMLEGDLAERREGYPDGCQSKSATIDLLQATSTSNNCAFVRLHAAVGDKAVLETASKMGIDTSQYPPGAGIGRSLGSDAPVRPLDMAGAYGVLANDGKRNPPHFVERIEDSGGKVLYQFTPPNEQVISRESARQVTAALKGVVSGGTATAARVRGHEIAGKTGTNEDGPRRENKDVWFVGYTPDLVVAVWSGYPATQEGIRGSRAQGGRSSAVMFREFAAPYLADRPSRPFPDPRYPRKVTTIKDPWAGRYASSEVKKGGNEKKPSRSTTTTTTTPRRR